MKIIVPFYSLYGHVYKMAKAVAEGAAEVKGAKVELRRIPETLPIEIIEKMSPIMNIYSFLLAIFCKSFYFRQNYKLPIISEEQKLQFCRLFLIRS